MDLRLPRGRSSTAKGASERRGPRVLLRWRTLATAGALLVMAACSNPLAVQDVPDKFEHTTSSGNHTTSSGNLSGGGR